MAHHSSFSSKTGLPAGHIHQDFTANSESRGCSGRRVGGGAVLCGPRQWAGAAGVGTDGWGSEAEQRPRQRRQQPDAKLRVALLTHSNKTQPNECEYGESMHVFRQALHGVFLSVL